MEIQGPSKRQRTDHDREEDTSIPTAPSNSVSHFHKLGSTVVPRSRPHVEDDLMSLYGLDAMQQSVRRALPGLPDTGVKLRKSYDGKVKDLEGKVKNTTRPGMLFSLLQYPDEEWQVQKVMGKELVRADHEGKETSGRDPADALLAKLGQAVTSGPGRLPADERAKWQSLLGTDDFNVKASSQTKAEKGPTASFKSQQHHSSSAPGSPRGIHAGPRPKRQGTKRRYHDDTFEGYGEGFGDDQQDNVSMSGADDDVRSVGGSMTKKRRKVSSKLRSITNADDRAGPSRSKENPAPVGGLDADHQMWLDSKTAALIKPAAQSVRGGRGARGGRSGKGSAGKGKK